MYPFLLVTHLLAAIAFIGTLFFEVVIWHRARQQLADTAQS
ncbi:membrane protein, partial [Pseudomonas lini]